MKRRGNAPALSAAAPVLFSAALPNRSASSCRSFTLLLLLLHSRPRRSRLPLACPPDGTLLPSSCPDGHRSSSCQGVLGAPKQTDAKLAGCAYRVHSPTSAAISALELTSAQSADLVPLDRPALERAGQLGASEPVDPRLTDPTLADAMLEARALRVQPTAMGAVGTPVPCSVHDDDPAPLNRPVLERPQLSDASELADPNLAAPARVPTSLERRLPAPALGTLATSAPAPNKRLKSTRALLPVEPVSGVGPWGRPRVI